VGNGGCVRRLSREQFVRFYLENATADWIADKVSYVPSSDEQAETNLQTLAEIVGT